MINLKCLKAYTGRFLHRWVRLYAGSKTITYQCQGCGAIKRRYRPGCKPEKQEAAIL